VVEDRADLAELIQRQLEHIGLTSLVATTGLAVGARLKAAVSTRSIPILAMTGMSPGREKCLKAASMVILSNHFRSTS